MMKIDFKHVKAITNFNGDEKTFDTTAEIGNRMMYNDSLLLDIGFEKLAEEIYFSKGEVEIPERYIQPLMVIIRRSELRSCVKRSLIEQVTPKEEEYGKDQ